MCCVFDPLSLTLTSYYRILSRYEGIYYRIYPTEVLLSDIHPWLASEGSVETSLQPLREEVAVEPRMGLKIGTIHVAIATVAEWDGQAVFRFGAGLTPENSLNWLQGKSQLTILPLLIVVLIPLK